MAEREGFEPSRPLRAYGISSAAPSTELGDRSATILPITAETHVLRRTHLSRARQRRVLRKTYRIAAP